MNRGGLKQQLSRTFLLQGAAIGIATVFGIFLAGVVLEEVLITQALEQEATHFWSKYTADPSFPTPDTHNLTGYIAAADHLDSLPAPLQPLTPGFHYRDDVPGFSVVHVSENSGQRLYLVFDGEQVNNLAAWFGIVPLTLVLVVLYLSVWVAYRVSQRAVSPITSLAAAVNTLDLDSPDPGVFKEHGQSSIADDEVRVLSTALEGFAMRLRSFVERERNFTRHASHELRTPLTVVSLATDMLQARPGIDAAALRDIDRIRRSVQHMQELVEAFLVLARESEQGLSAEDLVINDVVKNEIHRVSELVNDKPVKVIQQDEAMLKISAPRQVVSVLIGNLLRNAMIYTESGSVTARIDLSGVTITDTGIGMTSEQTSQAFDAFYRSNTHTNGDNTRAGGHGLGLSIVKRLSDRFGWKVTLDSTPSVGTTVHVDFS